MNSDNIHLVKAAFKKQFELTMIKNGVSADFYFKKVKLPTADPDPESLLPIKPFYHLINIVAVNENIPDFGSQVAQMTPWHKVPSLAAVIENSSNLKNFLETFCTIASGQSSCVKFEVIENDSGLKFCYSNSLNYKGDIQMELYRITSMIQLVQLAAGKKWRPESIDLNMPESKTVEAASLLTKSKINFSQTVSAISIERSLLKTPVHIKPPASVNINRNMQADLNTEFVTSIRQIMKSYAYDKHGTLEDIASIAGISVRTLQRRLTDHQLKFSDLLNQAKFECAKDKLQTTDIPISEIAISLGYSDAANFSRAFHRWAEVSPRDFRQEHRQA